MPKRFYLIFAAVFTLFTISGIFAQTCMLVSEQIDPFPNDVIIKDWLESKGYSIDVATGDEVKSGFYSEDDFKAYDFVFICESISSSDGGPLKGAPTPIFTTELWGTKWDINGWCPNNATPLYYGNTTATETDVIILDGSHELAAGYPTDTELTLVTDSENATDYLTYSNPQIDYIPIAALVADISRIVVMGVEAGTPLYEAEKADGELPDGSVVSQNRVAAVGINANANNFMTDDAFKLIEAGINWILTDPNAAVESKGMGSTPREYNLSQNYPNPFNPTTRISFSLKENEYTTLKVFDMIGNQVATLVDGFKNAGEYAVSFNAADLPSGVYLYQLNTGNQSETRKMMLMK